MCVVVCFLRLIISLATSGNRRGTRYKYLHIKYRCLFSLLPTFHPHNIVHRCRYVRYNKYRTRHLPPARALPLRFFGKQLTAFDYCHATYTDIIFQQAAVHSTYDGFPLSHHRCRSCCLLAVTMFIFSGRTNN